MHTPIDHIAGVRSLSGPGTASAPITREYLLAVALVVAALVASVSMVGLAGAASAQTAGGDVTAANVTADGGAGATSGTYVVNFDEPVTATSGADALQLNYTLDENDSSSEYIVVRNRATGGTYESRVRFSDRIQLGEDQLGGLSPGDTLVAVIYESNSKAESLASDQTTVQDDSTESSGNITGRVSFREPIDPTDSSFIVTYEFQTADGTAQLLVENEIDSSSGTYFTTLYSNGSLLVDASKVGGLSEGDELTAALFASEADSNTSIGDTAVVGGGNTTQSGDESAGDIELSTGSIQFESVSVGETASKTVTIRNSGDGTLSVSNATLRDDAGVFGLENGGSFDLAPGETRDLVVTFAPDSQRDASTSLVIESDDPTEPTRIVYVASGRVSATVDVDNGTTRVEANATRVSPEDPVTIDVPEPEDRAFDLRNVSVATTEATPLGVTIATSDGPLSSTPDTDAGLPNRTRQLGNVSVDATVSDEKIRQVSFTHSVRKQRLARLDADPEDVVLYRYNETRRAWVEKDTAVVRETEQAVFLRTTADGFSEWTAAAKRPDIRIANAETEVAAETVGDELIIQVELTNTGGADGVFETKLLLNGEVVESRDVTVPDGGTVPVSFQRQISEAGEYEVRVNDVPVGTVTVEGGQAQVSQGNETDQTQSGTADGNGSEDGGSGIPAVPIVLGLVVLLVAASGVLYARSEDDSSTVAQSDDDETGVLETEGFDSDDETE